MGGKNSAPAAPDYSKIAAASEKAANYSFQLGKEQLAWAKEQYASDRTLTDQVVGSFLSTMDETNKNAIKDRARYESIYQPLEDDLAFEARDYATDARRDKEMGAAQSQVAQQFDQARQSAQRDLEGYGINPSATRFQALDVGVRTQQAAAAAAAGTNASNNVDAVGRTLRSEAINVGRGYPGQIAGSYATAMNAGNGAVGNNLNTTASGANTMGTAQGWQSQGTGALNTWGNTLNMGYQNQMAQYQANQQSSSGWGSALGMIGGLISAFEDGGPVPDEIGAGPPGGGGAIPTNASPSGGARPDDVNARVNAGEFVIPTDTVEWFGQKHMYSMIDKANQEREKAVAQTGAIPSAKPQLDQPAGFQSAIPSR